MFGPWYELSLSHWNGARMEIQFVSQSIDFLINENVTQFERCSCPIPILINIKDVPPILKDMSFEISFYSSNYTFDDCFHSRFNSRWPTDPTNHFSTARFIHILWGTLIKQTTTIVTQLFSAFFFLQTFWFSNAIYAFISIPFVCTRYFFGFILEKNPFIRTHIHEMNPKYIDKFPVIKKENRFWMSLKKTYETKHKSVDLHYEWKMKRKQKEEK